jgi:hypothetical protein
MCLKAHSRGPPRACWAFIYIAGWTAPDAVAAARTPLVAEYCKGSERYGHLNDDRAEREQPDFSLGLRIHGSLNAQRLGSFRGSRGDLAPHRVRAGFFIRPASASAFPNKCLCDRAPTVFSGIERGFRKSTRATTIQIPKPIASNRIPVKTAMVADK